MNDELISLLVVRNSLRDVEWARDNIPDLQSDEALLKITSFAFTANNVSYALFGDKMGYWKFFPAPGQFGHPPVWGFAEVVATEAPGLSLGERIYGLFPIASHCVLQVGDLTETGLVAAAEWRRPLPAPYNWYVRVAGDPSFVPSQEAVQAIFRPLFSTSFLIADFLQDNAYFGASQVLISSASSKTALGLGYVAKNMPERSAKVIGLTSPSHYDFVSSTGYFDEVRVYADIPSLEVAETVFVDISGGAKVRAAVHDRYRDNLKYSCAVGGTHWEDPARSGGLAGPKPQLFFAPGHVERRRAEGGDDWMSSRYGPLWNSFLSSTQGWLATQRFAGMNAVERLYRDVLEGAIDPRCAPLATLHDDES
jgi:hypothetical protein